MAEQAVCDRDSPALRHLRASGVAFTVKLYEYKEGGGTQRSSECLGVDEHAVVKTLVFEDAAKSPVIILQHGDCVVDTAAAARGLSTKKLRVATPEAAEAATGYLVGGTSPFGTRTAVRVFVEESILALPKIIINGGGRGLLVEMAAQDLMTALPLLQPIRCAKAK